MKVDDGVRTSRFMGDETCPFVGDCFLSDKRVMLYNTLLILRERFYEDVFHSG